MIEREYPTISLSPVQEWIWRTKYRQEGEWCIEDTWMRVAKALASAEVEEERAKWEEEFYHTLYDFKFLPGGRILAGAGSKARTSLFNCFVMGEIEDSISGIFSALKEAAITMQQGGGVGYDFSTIRPKGSLVKGVGADASGPLSFMDVWDAMCRTIMSAGSRRGAMMATMRCNHPDIMDFIDAKREPGRLRMFNLSVLVTDEFVKAVENDHEWPLVFGGKIYSTVRAKDLWEKIMKSSYDYAEPGVLFIDTINNMNLLNEVEIITATNPCGEQPLPPYGLCLLGSINLTKFIIEPFTPDARFDVESYKSIIQTAVRMLDNVIEISPYPLRQHEYEARQKRRIGLGVTGFADALVMLGEKYGTYLWNGEQKTSSIAYTIFHTLQTAAHLASVDLGLEKGAYPLYTSASAKRRNSHLTSIAPTATISLLAGNVSSGIEPIFAESFTRKIRLVSGAIEEHTMASFSIEKWKELYPTLLLPDNFTFVEADKFHRVSVNAHIETLALAQLYIDSAVSKTINVTEDYPYESFKNIYMQAYLRRCKGCTVYRPNDIVGSVLSVKPTTEIAAQLPSLPSPYPNGLFERGTILHGTTTKIRWPHSEHAVYVTLNRDSDGRMVEVFVNSRDPSIGMWATAFTRLLSAVFRRETDASFVIEELLSIHDPKSGGAWIGQVYVPSLIAQIGRVIEENGGVTGKREESEEVNLPVTSSSYSTCPKCQRKALRKVEGCEECTSCDYAKCG